MALSILFGFYILNLLAITVTEAERSLVASSLVTCKQDSGISANGFDIIFNPEDGSVHYTLDLVTEIHGYVYADIDVYAYGFKIISKTVDFCSMNWKQFCPLHPGNVQIDSIEYIAKEYTEEIPKVAYEVPDIDTYARIKLYDSENQEYLACLQVFFTNGKTVSQTGVKWATAIIAGAGLLLSGLLSIFGNSAAASHIAANTVSLFFYFQSVVVVAMQHVHSVPPIAAAWSENLAWSMGLIKVDFMQRITRWYIKNTGGEPSLNLTSRTSSILTQKRSDSNENILYGNVNTLIFRGIRRFAYRLHMENTSVVSTSFAFFILFGYLLILFVVGTKLLSELMVTLRIIKPSKLRHFRQHWHVCLRGAILKYVYICFTQVTIFVFWEFTELDSPAVVFIGCLLFILSLETMIQSTIQVLNSGIRSKKLFKTPVVILYQDESILGRYGFYYTMFRIQKYWWNIILLPYLFAKSAFVGLSQSSGKTQAISIFILDLLYYISLLLVKPYLDRATNVVNISISTVNVLNSFFFVFFSDIFGQPYSVSAIMGWVFFILNATFSLLLLLMILSYTWIVIFSQNPDTKFWPAKDDRTCFQNGKYINSNISITEELAALGKAAKSHKYNWQNEICTAKPIQAVQETPETGIEIITLESDSDDLGFEDEDEYIASSYPPREREFTRSRTERFTGHFNRH